MSCPSVAPTKHGPGRTAPRFDLKRSAEATLNALSAIIPLALFGCEPTANPPIPVDADPGPVTLQEAMAGLGGEWIDLSYAFSEETVYWPTEDGFQFDTVSYGPTPGGYFYSAFAFASAEHGGTHLDAPIHFSEGRLATDQIPLDALIGPAVVVDVSEQIGEGAGANPDYEVTPGDFEAWEESFGAIPDGSILLVRTGWGARYGDREAYLGTAMTGPEAVPQLHFPGIHPDAARWLLDNRSITAVGIDTPSIDYGQSTLFETHQILYGADLPGFENVASLDRLPPTGAYVVALPMKIEGGSGGPLRIVAFVPAG